MTKCSGRLTTHVLDTALGRPASGLTFTLYRLKAETRETVGEGRTNADGRAESGPLLEGEALSGGLYELVFAAGDYLAATGVAREALFYDLIPIRFIVGDGDAHYHVPLILSRYGYTTYRGS